MNASFYFMDFCFLLLDERFLVSQLMRWQQQLGLALLWRRMQWSILKGQVRTGNAAV
jgi:hypothetical protein